MWALHWLASKVATGSAGVAASSAVTRLPRLRRAGTCARSLFPFESCGLCVTNPWAASLTVAPLEGLPTFGVVGERLNLSLTWPRDDISDALAAEFPKPSSGRRSESRNSASGGPPDPGA